ncbi:beta-glucosidase family protein [Raineyella fluvialis]|uniref:Glycosyl hydrolase n=1 Tax=Raineyella fluvialis TaxID=2662261 RepID=A0A5Q2FC80_9ACTN|nr:glycoside hydrolase family 3 C-terminal domain-containing protein [Raineyella fluvialis]QGF23034.1 glycosyl hydrolase [Raineyella fluvialis]
MNAVNLDTTPDTLDTLDTLRDRVARLTLEQKVALLTGADFWSVGPEPDAGLRRLVVSDGPVGVRGEFWDDRDWSANSPSPSALAATWDPALLDDLGRLMAGEARRKGVDTILAPTVNLHRTPVGGRHFECYSEDPVLSGELGSAWVKGVQAEGVGACVKHFVGNDQETDRMTADCLIDEQTLRELYLAPFEIIEDRARPWAYMAAYNKVNGVTGTESPLIDQVLKGEWGSDALIMSDWTAARSTEASANAGLDLVMPGPAGPWGDALVTAVREGRVPEATIDDKVARLLLLAARCGALDTSNQGVAAPLDPEQVAAAMRRFAAAGFVLVKNDRRASGDGAVLPVSGDVRSIAVVGPNAVHGRTAGGGSASVLPERVVHPAAGIAAALPQAEVRTALGVHSTDRVPSLEAGETDLPDGSGPGLQVEYLDATGAVLAAEQRRYGNFNWIGTFGTDIDDDRVASVRVSTLITARTCGDHRLGASGVGHLVLTLDGEIVADDNVTTRPGADVVEGMMRPPQLLVTRHLDAGETTLLTVEYAAATGGPLDLWVLQVNLEAPHGTDDEEIAAASALARASDATVVVVGTTEEVESEGFDRTSLALPGRQDDLVNAVLDADPDAVIVVNAGAPVEMPWLDRARAVLIVWFPGQQFGEALADVLTGITEPGGRMPTTWGRPGTAIIPQNVPDADGTVTYAEGLTIGYRAYEEQGVQPAVWFGHGMGYTSWVLSEAGATEHGVRVTVTNTGDRPGSTVAQVYLSRPDTAVRRPARWLAAFGRVSLAPGDSRTLDITLPERAFRHWDVDQHHWAVEPGEFRVHVGLSAADTLPALPIVR